MEIIRQIQYWIYYFLFFLYKKIMLFVSPSIIDIWYRNSFCEDYWVFGKSDIDISILVNSMPHDEGRKIAKYHNLIKKIIPIIGEACYCDEKIFEPLKACINPIELKRDKKLSSILGTMPQVDKGDQVIFLSKFLINNIFKKDLHKRTKKIEYYLSVSEVSIDIKNLEGIKKFISTNTHLDDFGHYENLCRDIVMKKNNHENDAISSHEYALLFNFLAYLNLERNFNESDKLIIKKNLMWELWGIYSYQFFADETIKNHIRNIINSSKKILNSTDQKYIEDLAMQLRLI